MSGDISSKGSEIGTTQLEKKKPLLPKTSLLFAGCSVSDSIPPEFHLLDFKKFEVAPVKVFKSTVSESLNIFVVATYKDLVLCSFSHDDQGSLFGISNPYTKEYMFLPDSPLCSQRYAHVGFICESDRLLKVVRIHEFKGEPAFEFMVEVFTSQTAEWTQSVVQCPQGLKYDDIRPDCQNYSGIACNGSLYWLCSNGSLLELKLNNSCTRAFGTGNYEYHCRFISAPESGLEEDYNKGRHWSLGVFQGKLRLSQTAVKFSMLCWNVVAWDLEERDGMIEWCMKENVDVHDEVAHESEMTTPLAFNPNDEGILYLLVRSEPEKPARILTFNIRTKMQIQAVQVPRVHWMNTFELVNTNPSLEVPPVWSISCSGLAQAMRSGEFRLPKPFGLSAFFVAGESERLSDMATKFKIILGSSSVARQKILAEMGYEFTLMTADIDEKSIRKEKPEELVMVLAQAKADAIISQLQTTDKKEKDAEPTIVIAADTELSKSGITLEPFMKDTLVSFYRGHVNFYTFGTRTVDLELHWFLQESIRRKLLVADYVEDAEPTLLITSDQVVVYEGVIREKPSGKEEAWKFLKDYSGGYVATVGYVLVTNLKTGFSKGELDRAEIYFHKIPDEVIEQMIEEGTVLKVAGGLIIEHPLMLPYVRKVVGTFDSVMGLPKDITERLLKEAI